jgi:two-component system, NarL family, response regulator DesR
LIAQGFTNQEVAQTLTLSTHTVRNHISSIFNRLGVSNRRQAVNCARERGLLRG